MERKEKKKKKKKTNSPGRDAGTSEEWERQIVIYAKLNFSLCLLRLGALGTGQGLAQDSCGLNCFLWAGSCHLCPPSFPSLCLSLGPFSSSFTASTLRKEVAKIISTQWELFHLSIRDQTRVGWQRPQSAPVSITSNPNTTLLIAS